MGVCNTSSAIGHFHFITIKTITMPIGQALEQAAQGSGGITVPGGIQRNV